MANRRSVLAAAGAVMAGGLWSMAGAPGRGLFAVAPAMADAAAADANLPAVPDMTLGSSAAKVHVIEYASFTCPHCADFHASVWPRLKRRYVDTGKISFTIRGFYRNSFDLLADTMALCGGPMRYFGIVDVLFDTQNDWTDVSTNAAAKANLRKIGQQAGLTDAELTACMDDSTMQQAMVAKWQKYAAADNVRGTPTFVIDGTTYENMGYRDFAKILDAELAKRG